MDNVHGDPATCTCECHTLYDPKDERDTYTFISHGPTPCCGPALKGSRVETLPEMTAEEVQDINFFRRGIWRMLGIPGEPPELILNEDDLELKSC